MSPPIQRSQVTHTGPSRRTFTTELRPELPIDSTVGRPSRPVPPTHGTTLVSTTTRTRVYVPGRPLPTVSRSSSDGSLRPLRRRLTLQESLPNLIPGLCPHSTHLDVPRPRPVRGETLFSSVFGPGVYYLGDDFLPPPVHASTQTPDEGISGGALVHPPNLSKGPGNKRIRNFDLDETPVLPSTSPFKPVFLEFSSVVMG